MEKLIYLIWDHPPEGSNAIRDAILGDCVPRLLAVDPLGLTLNLDDADSNIPGSVALPKSELAVVAQLSIWLHAHDFRSSIESVIAEFGIRRRGIEANHQEEHPNHGRQHFTHVRHGADSKFRHERIPDQNSGLGTLVSWEMQSEE